MRHSATIPPRLSEEDILQAAGPRAFQRGRQYYLEGAVLDPRTSGDDLCAEVAAGSDEPYHVEIVCVDGNVLAICDCPSPDSYCKHAVAVLLAWLHRPGAFENEDVFDGDASGTEESTGNGAVAETPAILSVGVAGAAAAQRQLVAMLEQRTMAELRQIARRRAVPARANAKVDLVAQLAGCLLEPRGLQAAFAGLNPDERVALDLVQILSGDQPISLEALLRAYAGLGVRPPDDPVSLLGDLRDRGLLGAGRDGRSSFVPAGIAACMPSADYLVKQGTTRTPSKFAPPAGLPADELLYHVWRHIALHGVKPRPIPERTLLEKTAEALRGWHNLPEDVATVQQLRNWDKDFLVTTLPPPPPLTDEDIQALAPLAAGSSDRIELAFHTLRALGMLGGKDSFLTQEEPLRHFLREAPASRRRIMIEAWLLESDWIELTPVLRADPRLRMRRRVRGYGLLRPQDLAARFVAARQILIRLLLRLEEGVWYRLTAVAETFRQLATGILVHVRSGDDPSEPDWRLDWQGKETAGPQDPIVWALACEQIVATALTTPLAWLGAATIAERAGDTVFRLDGLRDLLAGIAPKGETFAPATIGEDLTLVVPPGHADLSVHDALLAIAEPGEATPAGLRYRLTPASLRAAFAGGHDATSILAFLERLAPDHVPQPVRAAIHQWWQRYGQLHLYPDCTLIELADDYALPELLASTGLARHLVYQFSPRLIAVDPSTADTLIEELVRKGHTPKVAEGAG